MSLVTVANVRALINTALPDEDLQSIIDRVEEQITARIGQPQDDELTVAVTRTLRGEGTDLYLPTNIEAVVSILEDGVMLTAEEYCVWGGGVIERMPFNARWGNVCVVTYKPSDDRPKRRQVIIDLVRLTLERTALKSESIAGEYAYSAPENWNAELRKAMKTLEFQAI